MQGSTVPSSPAFPVEVLVSTADELDDDEVEAELDVEAELVAGVDEVEPAGPSLGLESPHPTTNNDNTARRRMPTIARGYPSEVTKMKRSRRAERSRQTERA